LKLIDTLIDKQDMYEVIRDKVALILANETISQQALAVSAGKDSTLWEYKVYTEKNDPFELVLDADSKINDGSIINVWLDSASYPEGSIGAKRQTGTAIINIDCVSGKTAIEEAGITTTADERASLDSERIARLARNIMLSADYTYLELRGTVLKVWVSRITKLQPDRDDRPSQNVMATRVSLEVKFNDYGPEITPTDLEDIYIDIEKDDTGQVLASIQIDAA
jgi:hypothetical protein